ncbi:MAG: lamin tail domain-containing protein, partial [Myxococcota bacterium]|nr:lamin tail domain-containing protein [Myxococcota bacterium]
LGEIPVGTMIEAGGYLLIGDEQVSGDLGVEPDVIMSMSLGNAGSNAEGIRIVDCNEPSIDTVIYGEPLNESDGWRDDFGNVPTSFAPKPRSGQSTGRVPNGSDSDDSGIDFALLDFTSPWGANDAIQSCDGATDIKINEFMPNPDSEESSADETNEWVELYNNSSLEVDLSGWALQWGTSSYGSEFVIPQGTSIAPNSHILIGGENVEGADVVVPEEDDLSMGAASSNADALRLLHCGPGVADTVIYGPSDDDGIAENTDEWEDDGGNIAVSIAPKAVAGISISRRKDGQDSDDSGSDFMLSIQSTPGEANPEVECQSGTGTIKINEIFPNPDGTDGGSEWIEFYNTGMQAVRLDSWTIETASSSWSSRYSFPAETIIEPQSFLLLGEELVPLEVVDLTTTSSLSLGNASTGLDGVRLKDCPGEVEDTILYGKGGAVASSDEVTFYDDDGGESFAIFPDSGLSIGRYPDGEDSNDNRADFQSNMQPSPGIENIENASDNDENINPEVPSKGCGREPSGGDSPSKCSYVYGIPNAVWLSFLFVWFRRRKN